MNVLLVNSNITRCARVGYGLTPAPAGLISIAGVLRRRGHNVRICQVHNHVLAQDEEDLPLLREEIQALLRESSPDVVAISVRNVGAQRRPLNPFCLIQYYSAFYDARVVRALRMLSSVPVVIGGTAFSVEPGLYMKFVRPDYGLIGEGEESLPALLDALGAGREAADIPGLVRDASDMEGAARTCGHVTDMSILGAGACDVVADFPGEYYLDGGFATVQTKRGCAMSCTYCTTPFFEGHRYRYRPMGHVIDEIKAYQEHWGAKHFFFVDATFNHPIDHALDLCNAILEAGLDIEWYSEVTAGAFNEELCRAMVRSGCIGVSLTPDSCCESVLKAYGKGFGVAEVKNAVTLLRKHGIPFQCHLIVGGPRETKETFAESVAFCSEHIKDEVAYFYDKMVITRRAPVFQTAVNEGLIDPTIKYEDMIARNDFRGMKGYEYFFPHLKDSREELLAMMEQACTGRLWLVASRDYQTDPETREYSLRPEISARKGDRPWWRSMQREDAGAA